MEEASDDRVRDQNSRARIRSAHNDVDPEHLPELGDAPNRSEAERTNRRAAGHKVARVDDRQSWCDEQARSARSKPEQGGRKRERRNRKASLLVQGSIFPTHLP